MLPSNDQGGLTSAIFIGVPSLCRRAHRHGLAVARHQPAETTDAFGDAGPRRPAGEPVELANVTDIPALIADAPIAKGDGWTVPVLHRDAVDQLQQAQRVFASAADIEGLARDLGKAVLG